jgi:hypothetical protein
MGVGSTRSPAFSAAGHWLPSTDVDATPTRRDPRARLPSSTTTAMATTLNSAKARTGATNIDGPGQ